MKKGFTMIELIFVIVVLGILASVAIPRLASTRIDAQISSAIANLRTLMSDLAAYHVTTGSFAKDTAGNIDAKAMTNVKLGQDKNYLQLKVGSQDNCIEMLIMDKDSTKTSTGDALLNPIGIQFSKGTSTDSVCTAVQNAQALNNLMKYGTSVKFCSNDGKSCTDVNNFVALESSISVY